VAPQSMIHHIQEEWLIELETKLHLATLKSDRLTERLNKILARVSDVCQKPSEIPNNDTPRQIKPKFWQVIKQKLAIKHKE